jgi:hypothetical protein
MLGREARVVMTLEERLDALHLGGIGLDLWVRIDFDPDTRWGFRWPSLPTIEALDAGDPRLLRRHRKVSTMEAFFRWLAFAHGLEVPEGIVVGMIDDENMRVHELGDRTRMTARQSRINDLFHRELSRHVWREMQIHVVSPYREPACVAHDDCAEDEGLGQACWRAAHPTYAP